MEFFSADTLPSSSHTARSATWFSLSRPSLSRSPPSPPWLTSSDSFDPAFIASCTQPDYPHLRFARYNALQRGPPQLLCADSPKVYPGSPSSSSPPKSTMPLSEAEEAGEFAPLYSTHLVGVLDSPPVVRRVDLASQKPLTPPPTVPHPTLNLPDADFDMPFYYDHQVEEIEEGCDTDESYPGPSQQPSPHFTQLPLSPLSPSWDPPGPQALSIHDFPESNTLFSVCDSSTSPALEYCHPSPRSPHESSSLLDVDAPHPLLAPTSRPWPSESDPELPSSSAPSSSLPSLTDYDELPPPSSPLISRLDLPDLEEDGLPKIVPSSPSRRSFSGLPDSDIETSDDPTSDLAPALPGQPLLSLPGADTDDDLIPRIAPSPSCSFPFFATPNQPLLFIDDPRDVPLPRSPSPEDFDLCLSPEDITDPELAKLFDLRKRSIAAERAARRLESLTEDVDLFTRAEARKIRKRERERCKEVGALMRLKLGDGIAMCPAQEQHSPPPSESDRDRDQGRRRGVIGSMSQLVAQMVFRRNETSRPLAKRKTSANGAREYIRSALSTTASE